MAVNLPRDPLILHTAALINCSKSTMISKINEIVILYTISILYVKLEKEKILVSYF